MEIRHKVLMSPFQLKHLTLHNRIVMPGMDTNFGDEEGNIAENTYRYYEQRAKGGAGLIIVEAAYFDKQGAGTQNMLALDSPRRIPQFARLTQTIKKHGARTLLQIYHAGSQATSFMVELRPVGPSNVPFRMSGETPQPLSKLRIREIVWGYAKACNLAMKAGFDGIEIHAGHGYLLNQFLSPLTNKRKDEYGGNFDDRIRLHLEVLGAVRGNCGSEFIIGFRLNGRDYIEGGIELEETCRLAQILEAAGVDLINITGGIFDSPGFPVVPYMNYPRGVFAADAAAVKQVLNGDTAVCVVGRINTPEAAEEILQAGKADLVALGRALIADPDFPLKAREGRAEQIRPCIACNACLNQIMTEQPVACTVNPELLGDQAERIPATEKRRVLIAGASVAGLEASRIAATRGHRVTLVESSDRIGGALHLASAASIKGELQLLLPYYERLMKQLSIDLRLGTTLTPRIVEQIEPEVLILATGSQLEVPSIEGLATCSHSSYTDVLSGTIPSGERICVLGGGMVGIDTADLLAGHDKDVTIVEPGKRLGADLYALVAREMERVIGENDRIQVYLETAVKRIQGNTLICDQSGRTVEIPFDHLVPARERVPSPDPFEVVDEMVPEVMRIGDCSRPGLIFDAIHSAYTAALAIGAPQPKTQPEIQPQGDPLSGDTSGLKARIAGKIKEGTFGLDDIPDYLELLVTACNSHPKIQKKAKKANLVFQFQVEGGADFWIRIDRGRFSTGQGSLDNVNVTIRMDRHIAPGIFSGQVNAASAYMAKELAFIGPMKHGIAFRTWVNLVKQELGI